MPSLFNSTAVSRQDEWVLLDSGLIRIHNVLAERQDLLNALGHIFQTYATLRYYVYHCMYTTLFLCVFYYQNVNRIFWILPRISHICFHRILHASGSKLQISDTPADNGRIGGQQWTEKREAPSGFSVRHEIKHLNIMKLWRSLKFTSQLQNKCFQFGATQASPKWDVVQGKEE